MLFRGGQRSTEMFPYILVYDVVYGSASIFSQSTCKHSIRLEKLSRDEPSERLETRLEKCMRSKIERSQLVRDFCFRVILFRKLILATWVGVYVELCVLQSKCVGRLLELMKDA